MKHVVACRERLPRRIADERVPEQFVGQLQQRGVEGLPSGRRRAFSDSPQIGGAETGLRTFTGVLAPQIVVVEQPGGTQDQ
jgi:hypothetical protein